jgi:hypothetical protein
LANPTRSWWFASTAIPLVVAAIGPLSNVLSVVALVTPWKLKIDTENVSGGIAIFNGAGIPDPRWYVFIDYTRSQDRHWFNYLIGSSSSMPSPLHAAYWATYSS